MEFKGHTHLLDAMALLRADGCNALHDRGRRRTGAVPARRPGRSASRDRVIFPGYRSDLSALYSAFDIFSLPSIDFGGETYPLVVLSALSAGLPVAASDVGDVRYMVRDGYNGFLLPPGDAARHAEALQTLIDNEVLRREMGALCSGKSPGGEPSEAMVGSLRGDTRWWWGEDRGKGEEEGTGYWPNKSASPE
ncbi:MAG: glycosyltransferase [Ignavibacteria bacterium]|nr:glycosyltransferase [Ignavibacteria bacterium]